MSYDYPAALIITDTSAHTGRFGKVHALADASCTFVSESLPENGSSTINGITMKAGTEIEGIFTSITQTSAGSVIAYSV